MNQVKFLALVHVHAVTTCKSPLWREEKEHDTTKNSKPAESWSFMMYDFSQLTVTLLIKKMQAYLASSSSTGTVLSPTWCNKVCIMILSMSDSRRECLAFQSNSWTSLWVTCCPYLTHKPLTWLFCTYFYSYFHQHTTQPDMLFLVHVRDSAFATRRTGSYMFFLLPPQ